MRVSVLVGSLLLQSGAPATASPADHDLDTYSVCVAEGVDAGARARFVSDPFETGLDEMDARGFQEYVEQAYLKRRNTDLETACTSYHGRPAADAALVAATMPKVGVRIVPTKWRANFE